jgi:hypothetical protein
MEGYNSFPETPKWLGSFYRDSPAAARRMSLRSGSLALQKFRRADWSREASLGAGTLHVEICESTFYNVKIANWKHEFPPLRQEVAGLAPLLRGGSST